MILVDTSVWIDHLRRADATLTALLVADEVCTHPLVIQELALGSIANRGPFLDLLADLACSPVIAHDEALRMIEGQGLWGSGLSAVDVHLIGSTLLSGGSVRLWSRDRRRHASAEKLDVAYER